MARTKKAAAAPERPARHIEMADGTILDASAALAGGDLWIMWNDQTTMLQAMAAVRDPAKTARMIARVPGSPDASWAGYTSLQMIKIGLDGHTQARLRKE
jgi:hypothetical protein